MKIILEGGINEIKNEMRLFLGEKTGPRDVLRATGEAITKNEAKASEKPPQADEEPKKKASKAKKKKPEANGADPEVIDRVMVREKCAELLNTKGKEVLQEVLSNIGCRTFGDVKEEQLITLLKQVEGEL